MSELLEVNDKGYTLGLYLFIFMMASFHDKNVFSCTLFSCININLFSIA